MPRSARAAEILALSRAARPLSAPALGRAAPAGGDGPGDRARSAGLPLRRAALQSRRQAARGDAHRDQGAAPAAEDHFGLRHPRPDRGDDHGRPDRRHEGRPDRADRLAARALRPPGQHLRRRLHRLAGDELPAGHAAPQRRRRRVRARRRHAPAGAAQCRRQRRAERRPRHAARASAARRERRHSVAAWSCSSRPAPTPSSPAGTARTDVAAVFRERHDFAPGSTIHLVPDPRRAHLFDAGSGDRLAA